MINRRFIATVVREHELAVTPRLSWKSKRTEHQHHQIPKSQKARRDIGLPAQAGMAGLGMVGSYMAILAASVSGLARCR